MPGQGSGLAFNKGCVWVICILAACGGRGLCVRGWGWDSFVL